MNFNFVIVVCIWTH